MKRRADRPMAWLPRFWRSVWVFPLVILTVVVVLISLRLSGSSVGYYHFYAGISSPDPNLVAGALRPVRSDEWLVNTQMIVAQQVAGWPRINPNVGNGQDMSVIADVPYREWSVAFKPQNLAFFVLPLEYAFAFKWWALLAALIVAGYFFTLELMPGKRRLAVIVGLLVGFNPFVFWWYQTITIAPLTYALLLSVALMRLLRAHRTRPRIGWAVVITYLVVAFALVLYPPFQIPCALAMAAMMTGYVLELRRSRPWQQLGINALYAIGGGLVAGIIILLFIKTRSDVIATVANTIYPGKRDVVSGGYNPVQLLGNFLTGHLQSSALAAHYLHNQSEASNFILVAPYLILPSVYLVIRTFLKRRIIDWPLVMVNGLLGVLLARMILPWPNWPYRLLLLNLVPGERILIGLGLLGVLQLVLLYRHLSHYPRKHDWIVALMTAIPATIILLLVGRQFHRAWPLFVPYGWLIGLLAGAVGLVVGLALMWRTAVVGAGLLLVISVGSCLAVTPLYRGLGPIIDSPVLNMLEATPAHSRIAVNDSLLFENFPLLANRPTITGVEGYPQLKLWQELDGSAAGVAVYNRFAHVALVTGTERGFTLLGADHFAVKLPACDPFVHNHLDYIVSVAPLESTCLQPVDAVHNPAQTVTLYRVIP